MANALIPLGVTVPDFAGAYNTGQQAYQNQQEQGQKNALRQALQQYGPAAMRGDQNALAEVAKLDPTVAAGLMGQQQERQIAEKAQENDNARLEVIRKQAAEQSAKHVADMGESERQQAAAELDKTLAATTQAKTPEEFDAIVSQSEEGKQFVGQFDRRDQLIAMGLGLKDALTMGQSDQTEGFKTLSQRADAAGLAPGTPEYADFMRNGGTQRQENAPAGYRYGGTGNLEAIPGGPADPKVGARNAVPTADERKAGGMYERMTAAEQTLDKLATGGDQNLSLVESGLKSAGVPEGYALNPKSQQVLQAQRDWVRAKLRLESGAVIGEDEMREEIKTYFPQPGEDPATATQKKQARQQAMEQVRTQGGRSVSQDANGIAAPKSKADYDALLSGTQFTAPDGSIRVKP
jgi:hypothetical protein